MLPALIALLSVVTPPGAVRPAQPAPPRAAAATPRGARASDLPQIAFEKYTLANGLEVILHEDHRMPEVAVDVWYKVGSRDEEPGRTGFAHLFEHVMFQGSKHVPEDKHFEYLQKAGASQRQRLDLARPHQLLRGRPVEPARAGALAGERPHGLPARAHRRSRRRSTTSATSSRTSAASATRTAPSG